ncbi:MAG: methane monooxygenase/ammonia monooxygenase subunit A [Gammaproteobacteria bacterium]|jgi:methane/ammonia monooxygenase subunit A|nr:methane monooxygenase/ammonia monooxygenase subunit A [Gammaproteobacteria bacterium]|tara:strand:+ start:4357 stop:5196 length:840 start_codon:yes stop_codon:yes gene_type:complete
MTENDRAILKVSELSPQAIGWSRTLDLLIIVVAAFLIWSVSHISFLLLGGDWDFFIDWKDRQYWILIIPITTIIMAASFQAIFWNLFRLPIGATASLLLLLLGTWIVRYHSWEGLAYFPISLVVPGTCLMGALVLDAILVLSRSWLVTGMFGATLYGLLFYPANWTYMAGYFQPVMNMGDMTSVADLIGYVFPRAGTPEYIRIIERGTLRTFGDTPTWVSAFFAAFVCIFLYYLFWGLGVLACNARFFPVGERFKSLYGAKGAKDETAGAPVTQPGASS